MMSNKTCRVTLNEDDIEMISEALKAHAVTLMSKKETAEKGMYCIQTVGKLDYVISTTRGPQNATKDNTSNGNTNENNEGVSG